MANSGIPWVDTVFTYSVKWLYGLARYFGITYEEINVYIFCIAWPLFSILSVAWIIYLLRKSE